MAGVDYRKGAATFGATAGFGDVSTVVPEAIGRLEADRKIFGLLLPFNGRGQDFTRDLGVVGLAVSCDMARDWTGFVEMEAEFASGNLSNQRVGAGLRASF